MTTKNEHNQLNDAHSDEDVALASIEKSSAFMTQGRGPIPMEYATAKVTILASGSQAKSYVIWVKYS